MTEDEQVPETVEGEPANVPDEDQANVQAMAYWDRVVEDMSATAAELEDEGWDTLELHPGDVHVLPEHADPGLDVLLGDDEFRVLERLLGVGIEVNETEVFRASTEGMQYLVVVMQDQDEQTAVLAPLYYRISDPDATSMLDRAHDAGAFCTRFRTLSEDIVDVHHDDPSLFAPPEDDADEAADADDA